MPDYLVKTPCGREITASFAPEDARLIVVKRGYKRTHRSVKACPCEHAFKAIGFDEPDIWMCDVEIIGEPRRLKAKSDTS